jgi:tRNA 2-thiocytidine biosynthesis protein TtcA
MSGESNPEALEKRLGRAMSRAIAHFDMIDDGDRILVAISGGKDSYTLLHLMRSLQRKAPVNFELLAVNIDQGHPGYPGEVLSKYMAEQEYDFKMIREDTYSIVTEKIPAGKTFCSLCSRLRRGILYRVAKELGCNKIALGHHREDVLQTLLLNLFFSGQLGAMPPRLVADDGRLIVVRPLVYCSEDDIREFAKQQMFPILPCDLCGSQEQLQRRVVGRLIDRLEADHPGIKQVMLAALQNVRPTHLLDQGLWRSLGLPVAMTDDEGGELERAVGISPERLVRG